jgi:predicted nucleic acid-binding protein
MKPICIDANVFIVSTKGDETYSSDCRRVIQAVTDGKFYLIEPTICYHSSVGAGFARVYQ